jgi:molybdopterin converting factor small subunit
LITRPSINFEVTFEMIRVHVQLYSILREKLPAEANDQSMLELNDGAILQDLLSKLGINRKVVISVNDEHESDCSRLLKNGDEVKLFSSISGG